MAEFARTSFPTSAQWRRAVLAPNGCIYAFPEAADGDVILRIDTADDTIVELAAPETAEYRSATLVGDIIYAASMTGPTDQVLRLDTTDDSITTLTAPAPTRCTSICVAGTDLYAIPVGGEIGLKIDTLTDSVTSLGTMGTADRSHICTPVPAPNGKIYCPPFLSESTVLVIDTADDTSSTLSVPGGLTAGSQPVLVGTDVWSFARSIRIDTTSDTVSTVDLGVDSGPPVLAASKLWAPPSFDNVVVVVNPATEAVDTLALGGSMSYSAPITVGGTVWAVAESVGGTVLEVDTATSSLTETTVPGASGSAWSLVIDGGNGSLYGIGANGGAGEVLKITLDEPAAWSSGLTVELAFGFGPLEVVPSDDDWVDITEWVDVDGSSMPVATSSGRARARSDIEPGTATVRLENLDSRFDPRNVDGPYYGELKIGVPIRVRVGDAPGEDRWRGFVQSGWPQQFTERLPVVELQAHDLFGYLAQAAAQRSAFDATVTATGPDHWWEPNETGWRDRVGGLAGLHTGGLAETDPTTNTDTRSWGQTQPDGVGIVAQTAGWLSAATESLVIGMRFRLVDETTRASLTDPAEIVAWPATLLWQSEEVNSSPVGITVWPNYLEVNVNDDAGQRLATATTGKVRLMDGYTHSLLVHVPAATGDIEVWVDGRRLVIETDTTVAATTLVPGPLYFGGTGPGLAYGYPFQGVIDPILVWRDHSGTGLDALAAGLHSAATTGWAGQRLDERITAIITAMGAADRLGALDTSGIIARQAYRDGDLLQLLGQIEDTEQGRVWVDRHGELRFSARGWAWTDDVSTTVQATFSDIPEVVDAGDVLEFLAETVLTDSELELTNIAEVSSVDGRAQPAADIASIGVHGQRNPVRLTDLLHSSDRQSQSIAEWIIYSQGVAPIRLEQISFNVEHNPTLAAPIAAAIEEGWLVRLRKAPRVDTEGAPIGDEIDLLGHVVGVRHEFGFLTWRVHLTVDGTRAGRTWFRLDDSALDGPDGLAF